MNEWLNEWLGMFSFVGRVFLVHWAGRLVNNYPLALSALLLLHKEAVQWDIVALINEIIDLIFVSQLWTEKLQRLIKAFPTPRFEIKLPLVMGSSIYHRHKTPPHRVWNRLSHRVTSYSSKSQISHQKSAPLTAPQICVWSRHHVCVRNLHVLRASNSSRSSRKYLSTIKVQLDWSDDVQTRPPNFVRLSVWMLVEPSERNYPAFRGDYSDGKRSKVWIFHSLSWPHGRIKPKSGHFFNGFLVDSHRFTAF